MQYIEKLLDDDDGSKNSCWIAGRGVFDLTADNASVTLAGWLDVAAKRDNKIAGANLEVAMRPSTIASLPALMGDVAAALVGVGGLFEGGKLVDGYIELPCTDKRGQVIVHWVGSEGIFNLLSGEGALAVRGWLSRQDREAGKASADVRTARVLLTSLPHFDAVCSDVATALVSSKDSPLYGGKLKVL